MPTGLDDVLAAFDRQPRRPAGFHRGLRERNGVWELAEPVPVEAILDRFRSHGGFGLDDSGVYVPVHRPDAPAVTGEYLVFRPDEPTPCVEYFDFGRNRVRRLSLDELATAYPAWQLRYWDPAGSSIPTADPPTTARGPTEADHSPVGETIAPTGEALFEYLREFVVERQQAERVEARAAFDRLAFTEYVETYGGVRGLTGGGLEVDQYGQQVVLFHLSDTDEDAGEATIEASYGLHPGSEVIIHTETAAEGFPIEGEILAIDDRTLKTGIYWDRSAAKRAAESTLAEGADHRFRMGQLLDPVQTDRELDAIEAIEDTDWKATIVTGGSPPDRVQDPDSSATSGFDESQYRAMQRALRTQDIHCIHGPPGTGTTRTLVGLIAEAVSAGEKVLATAPTTAALETLVGGKSTENHVDPRSLHRHARAGDITVATVGPGADQTPVTAAYSDVPEWQADVVCATTNHAASVTPGVFDLGVVDRAGQATIPSTFVPFSKVDRLVLGGDHKQLPPIHASERDDREAIEPSLLEHLLELYDDVASSLTTQYRMHRTIASFPNAEFYEGQLTHGEANRDWTIADLQPLRGIQTTGTERTTATGSFYNAAEAKLVGREVSTLLHSGVRPAEISVITPYSGQVGMINRELKTLGEPEVDRIAVGTVEAFQGIVRDATVVSFVRSNTAGESGFLTFPSEGPRRLNVALTRARKRCVLVGDFTTLSTPAADETAAPVYGRLRDHLESVGCFEERTP